MILSPFWSLVAFSHGGQEHKAPVAVTPHKIHQSKFKFSLGVSVTKSLASKSGRQEGTANEGSSSHSHDLRAPDSSFSILDGGENHGDSGSSPSTGDSEGGGGTSAPAFDPILTARADYYFTKKYGFGAILGYGINNGIQDPEFGPTLKIKLNPTALLNGALTASYPASRSSKSNYKITTIKLVAGPNYEIGRYSLGVSSTIAYAWYSKTIIVDSADNGLTTMTNAAFYSPQRMLHGGADDGDTSSGEAASTSGPSGDNLASADREFSRYGARLNLGYKFTKLWRNDSAVGLAKINHQFGPSTWASDLTLTQISLLYRAMAFYFALSFYKEDVGLAAPTTPSASIGASYTIQ